VDRPTVPPSRTFTPVQSRAVRRSDRDSAETAAAAPRVDVRGWLGGIRLSGFMVIMLGLVVLATLVLVPTVGTYVDQRQQIDALRDAVAVSAEEVADLEAQRERWNDPAYITTQARERLYYVRPGEVVYLVDNDLPPEALLTGDAAVSDEVEQTRTDWMSQLVRSVTVAGLAQTAVEGDAPSVP
jgi:cell division protein FtsB